MTRPASGSDRRPRTGTWKAAAAASLVAALAIPALQAAAVFPMVHNLPKWDQWSLLTAWSAHFAGQDVLPHLMGPYNGHYNVVPRLVFFGLGLATDWDLRWEVALSYLAALGALAILVLMLRDTGERFVALAWVASLQVFSLVQFENFMSGYPFGQHLAQTAATAVVFLLTRPAAPGRRQIALAALAATVASFSWGAGLAAWFVGLAALLLRARRHRLAIALWSAASFGVLALAWLGARGGGMGGGVLSSGLDPLGFALAVLGKPLSLQGFPGLAESMLLGGLLAAAFAAALAGAWLLGQRDLAVRWGLLGALALASVALVAAGRVSAGMEQALASHYATAAYPLALATVVLGTACLFELRRRSGTAGRAAAALVLTVMLAAATVQPAVASLRILPVLRSWAAIIDAATAKLLAGTITDAEIRQCFHPQPELVRDGTALMERHGLALFAEAE